MRNDDKRRTTSSHQDEYRNEQQGRESESQSQSQSQSEASNTIALFGATGKTGNQFLRLALDAGYRVRALIKGGNAGNCSIKGFIDQPGLTLVTGDLTDEYKIKCTVRGSDCVVCMLGDTLPTKKNYPVGRMTAFLNKLYPIMKKEASISVFLYQATSLAANAHGNTPIFSKVLKAVAYRRNQFLQDQDAVIRQIAMEHGLVTAKSTSVAKADKENDNDANDDNNDENDPDNYHDDRKEQADDGDDDNVDKETPSAHFSFIVTRATVLLKDGPSTKKLAASKSQPGPFPVTHVDLAEFSLNALLTEKLYNTCPYVVADSF